MNHNINAHIAKQRGREGERGEERRGRVRERERESVRVCLCAFR